MMPDEKFEWTEEQIVLLGQMPDGELAELLGTTRAQVSSKRSRRGIPIVRATVPKREFTSQEDELLGTMMDTDIAHMMGITRAAVGHRRRHLNIPAFFATVVMVEVSGEKFKARRTLLGLSYRDMVSKGTQTGSYCQIETGHTKLIGLKRLEKLAEVLQCRASDLMPSKPDTADTE